MKVLFLHCFLAVAVIFGVGSSKNTFEAEIQDYMDKYLILRNTQKYCEGKQLLLAPNTDNLFNFNTVLDICESKKECDFISFTPKRQLRNSIHYENEEVLSQTGANWICSGTNWVDSRLRKYWVTAIKERSLRAAMGSSYNLTLNTTGECDDEHVVIRIRDFTAPHVAAEECDRMPNCKFIIFNYNRRFGSEETDTDRIILCSQTPVARTRKLGYFIAAKPEEEKVVPSRKGPKKQISLTIPQGGVITPDEYYKAFEKGEVVPPQKL